MGFGSLICAMPQFLVGPVHRIQSQLDICHMQTNETDFTIQNSCELKPSAESSSHLRRMFIVLLVGQLICGIGASPLYTLGVTFLDENVPQVSSSLYLGFFFGLSVLGPAIGFVLGGSLLRIDGDVDKGRNQT